MIIRTKPASITKELQRPTSLLRRRMEWKAKTKAPGLLNASGDIGTTSHQASAATFATQNNAYPGFKWD